MKAFKSKVLIISMLVIIFSMVMAVSTFAATVTTTGCFQSYETDLNNNQLTIRMKALEGSFTVNNSGGTAKTYTVTVKNVDPDYVTINNGTLISRGVNSFVFSLNIPANGTTTVNINPWYTPVNNDFYFIAWSDNQDGTSVFPNKLLVKAAKINPILSVSAGDVTTGTAPDVGGERYAGQYPPPYDIMRDQHLTAYLSLLQNYNTPVFEVPGNHDTSRGGWLAKSDAAYDNAQAVWRKILGPIDFSFDVADTHFSFINFHYDMPTWTKRWGAPIDQAYLRLGTNGYGITLPNDTDGDNLYNWISSDLTAAASASARITVSHHNFNMFVSDHNTVATARSLFASKNVNYMISGHDHNYQTGTDSASGVPYLVTGDASASNPGFSLVHVNGTSITQQHMYADNLNLNPTITSVNNGTAAQGTATVTCSGYNVPFVRLKFKLSNNYEAYTAKDSDTGASIPAYSHKFADYTVVYVETSINNGQTRNIQVDPVGAPTGEITLQAESYNSMSGILNSGTYINGCDNGEWVCFNNVNLGSGYTTFTANLGVPSQYSGQNVEVRLDSPTGTLLGTLTTAATGGWTTFQQQSTTLTGASGIHNVYIVFKGSTGIGNFDWFKFGGTPAPLPITLQAESYNTMSGILNSGTYINGCDNGEWVCFNNVNLGSGYTTFTANLGVPSQYSGQSVEVRLDSPTGTLLGTLTTAATGGWTTFQQQSTTLTGASGIHNVYVKFRGATGVGNFDWFMFS